MILNTNRIKLLSNFFLLFFVCSCTYDIDKAEKI